MVCSYFVIDEIQFVGQDKEIISSKFPNAFLLDEARIGRRFLGGSIYWRKLLIDFCTFLKDQTKETLQVPDIPRVFSKD